METHSNVEQTTDEPLMICDTDLNSSTTTLHVNHDAIKMDALGPIIINTDGTMSRIPNWNSLTERERNVALRRIAKRNEERKQELNVQGNENNQNDNI